MQQKEVKKMTITKGIDVAGVTRKLLGDEMEKTREQIKG